MNLSWKFLPIVAASALALLVLMPGGGARPVDVSAAVDSVIPSADSVTSGGTVTIAIDADDGSTLTVSLVSIGSGTAHSFTLTDCGDCPMEGDDGTSLSIDATNLPNSGNVTVTLEITCTSQDPVQVNATQGGTENASVTCNPPSTATPTATATVTGTPATSTPTVTTTPSGDNTITLSAVQPNTQCGQPVFLFATVKNASGGFVAGATVTFTASGGAGSFSPNSAVTVTDGVASSTWTPPSTGSSTVTITATSGGKTATASVPVNCAAAATATATQPSGGSTVRPPSTGEAGLAEGSNWTLYAGIAALVGTAFTGVLVVARRRA